jgi:hypothetical protein
MEVFQEGRVSFSGASISGCLYCSVPRAAD